MKSARTRTSSRAALRFLFTPRCDYHDRCTTNCATLRARLARAGGRCSSQSFRICFAISRRRDALRIVRTYLGPAPGYFMRDRVLGKVTVHYELEVVQAKPNAGGVLLTLASNSGEKREFQADHVICGTGYKPELARLPFLDVSLRLSNQRRSGHANSLGELRILDARPLLRRSDCARTHSVRC